MSPPSRLDYAYAVGRVRAMETRLISKGVLEGAVEEQTLSSSMKVIVDAGHFREERVEFRNARELDGYLDVERRAFLADVTRLFREESFRRLIEHRHRTRELWSLARESEYAFVRDFVRHLLDLKNLKVFLRARYLRLPLEKVDPLLIAGGFLEKGKLGENFSRPLSEVSEVLHATPYKEVWDQAVDSLTEHDTFADLERGGEDFLMAYLRRAHRIVFGPEPVFAFILAKLKELEQVRFIGMGKLLQIPAQILRRRISETYV